MYTTEQPERDSRDARETGETGESEESGESGEQSEGDERRGKSKPRSEESSGSGSMEPPVFLGEFVMGKSAMCRHVVLTFLMDAPGTITSSTVTTFPQFALEISIEGQNTYVAVEERSDAVFELQRDFDVRSVHQQHSAQPGPLLPAGVLRRFEAVQAQDRRQARAFRDSLHDHSAVEFAAASPVPGVDEWKQKGKLTAQAWW